MISGNIPEKITILTRQPYKVGNVDVIPAFVSDAKNEATLETGRTWSKGRYWSDKNEPGPEYVSRENKGVGGYRILDLEVRSEGGRAYKVVSPEGFYVDLREDVLLDTIQEVGISAGGILNGTYLFATVGSQMKLIREGSALHKDLIGATTRRNSKKISSKDLEIGGVYATVGGQMFVFGGFVDTTYISAEYQKYSYRGATGYKFGDPKPMKKAQLWIEVINFQDGVSKTFVEAYKSYNNETFEFLYFIADVLKEKKVLEKVGQLDTMVDGQDYVTFVKEKSMPRISKEDGPKIYSKLYNMTASK